MRFLIDDAIDLLRFRVRPLEMYQYPVWQTTLFLVILAIVSAPGAAGFGDNMPGKIAFMLTFSWLDAFLFARFMAWWLRLAKWQPTGSLFGLMVIANGVDFIQPLTSWLSPTAAVVANAILFMMWLSGLVNALSKLSGVSIFRIMFGILCFSPLALVMFTGTLTLSGYLGWVPDMATLQSQVGSAMSVTP